MGSGVSTVQDAEDPYILEFSDAIKEENYARVEEGIKNLREYFGNDEEQVRAFLNIENTYGDHLSYDVSSEEKLFYNTDPELLSYVVPMTFLQQAVFSGDFKMCEMLLESGADPNRKNEHGLNALHFACILGDENITKLLLGHDANPDLKTDREICLTFGGYEVIIDEGLTANELTKVMIQSLAQEDMGLQEEGEKEAVLNLNKVLNLLKNHKPKAEVGSVDLSQIELLSSRPNSANSH